MSRHSVFKGISRIIRKRSSMHSLSFSGGPTPPTVVLISLLKLPRTTEHPNRLIARLEYNRRPKGWPAGFPALPLASFDAEESAAEDPVTLPLPCTEGMHGIHGISALKSCIQAHSLSFSFSSRFHIDWWRIPSSMMHLYMYIYTLAIGIEEKGQVYLGKKVFARLVLPGKTSIRNEFNGFAYFSNVSVLPMNWKFYSRFEKECSYQRLLKFYYFEYFSFRAR